MSFNLKVLQVIPKLGYGGAETGCYDIAHYLPENDCGSYIVTSGGELLKFIDKKKVKIIKLPVHSKNPLLILPFVNSPEAFPCPEYSMARKPSLFCLAYLRNTFGFSPSRSDMKPCRKTI